MQTISGADIADSMDDFYNFVRAHRPNAIPGIAVEPVRERSLAITTFVNDISRYIKGPASCADAFSGDCIVPLAVLYLQKTGVLRTPVISTVYAVDDNSLWGLDIAVAQAKSLGVDSGIVAVEGNYYDASSWRAKLPPEGAGLVAAINLFHSGHDVRLRDFINVSCELSPFLFISQQHRAGRGMGAAPFLIKMKYDALRESTDVVAVSDRHYSGFFKRKAL